MAVAGAVMSQPYHVALGVAMAQHGVSRSELARRVGVSRQYVTLWLSGSRGPSAALGAAVERVVGVPAPRAVIERTEAGQARVVAWVVGVVLMALAGCGEGAPPGGGVADTGAFDGDGSADAGAFDGDGSADGDASPQDTGPRPCRDLPACGNWGYCGGVEPDCFVPHDAACAAAKVCTAPVGHWPWCCRKTPSACGVCP